MCSDCSGALGDAPFEQHDDNLHAMHERGARDYARAHPSRFASMTAPEIEAAIRAMDGVRPYPLNDYFEAIHYLELCE